MPSPAKLRAARGLLGLPREWLAKLAGVAPSAVLKAERGGDPAGMAAIVRVLEAEGAEFINGEQEGVRLRKAKPEDAAPAKPVGTGRNKQPRR